MGCNYSCIQPESCNGPLELVYDEDRLLLDSRPKNFNELFRVILNFVKLVKVPQDLSLE